MDPSALIFVALAVAWAVYLIPKALQHHDDAVRSRSVERFSHTMRVLARREPVNRRDARLVVNRPVATAPRAATPTPAPSPAPTAMETPVTPVTERRRAAVAAARRRRRVFLAILALNAVVVGLAAVAVVPWVTVAGPVVLLAAWLVACRLMVKKERAVAPVTARRPAPRERAAAPVDAVDEGPHTEDVPAVVTEDTQPVAAPRSADPALWDPVPVTLPTYVGKPAAARRTVRTIDLDDTGVWTSGRSEADSRIAREAEAAERAARSRDDGDASRAVGS